MSTIHISRAHNLGLENARERVEGFAQALGQELQASYEWSDNRLLFKRAGASGTVEVGPDSVDLNIELDAPFSLMTGAIEERINQRLDAALS